jgi:uracil-DNA glycosylase
MNHPHPLASAAAWSPAVHFLPMVGTAYDDGLVPSVRVLLLGESHYGVASDAQGWGRDCTQYNFDSFMDDACDIDNQSQFFRKLPRIVTRDTGVTQIESAAAWRRVAFANFVQDFVGAHARMRPTSEQWIQGQVALTEMAQKLRPDVVLVLGAQLWNHITEGYSSGEAAIQADRHEREVWLIPHDGGYARASWIYHPSTNYETLDSAIGVFAELLRRASLGAPHPEQLTVVADDGAKVALSHPTDA